MGRIFKSKIQNPKSAIISGGETPPLRISFPPSASGKGARGLGQIILVLLTLNLLLAACGGEEPRPTTTPNSPPPQTQTANSLPAAEETTAAPYNYSPDKTFIFGLSQEPVAFGGIGLDPANLTDYPSLRITRQIYDTLFEYKSTSMQTQPANFIKPNGVQVSDDGLTYTIHIGGGLKFSDGSDFDAEAIRFNFLRWAGPNSIYHRGDFSAYRYYFVDQQGVSGYPGNLDLVRLQTPDERTIVIGLKKPMPMLPQILAMPQFGLLSRTSFDDKGNFVKPVGSGPYVVDKAYDKTVRSEQRYMTLKKNPNYEIEKDPKKLPKRSLETLVLRVLPGNLDGLKELRDNHITATDKIRPEEVPANSNDDKFEIKRRPALNLAYLGMNQARPPFDNEEVRQAFAYAINLKALVANNYHNLGTAAAGFLPPASLNNTLDLKAYPYDPQKAKDLLAQAGYPDGISTPLELWVLPVPRLYYPDASKVAQAIIDDLAKINVKVVARDESWVSFNANRDDGRYSLFLGGWQGENGDPDEFFYRFFGEDHKDTGYGSPELQGYIRDARQSLDATLRQSLYQKANQTIIRDVPVLPLAYTDWPVAVRRDIVGYDPHPSGIESWANLSFR